MRHIMGNSMPDPDAIKNWALVKNPTMFSADERPVAHMGAKVDVCY